jgi:hypothetical protein
MYAADRHGSAHGAVYLELEVNQRNLRTTAEARKVGRALTRALARLKTRSGMA